MRDYWSPWRFDDFLDFERYVWNLDIFDWDPTKMFVLFLRMFSHLLFHLELFSTHMTSITLYMCVFMCKKHLKHFHVNCVGNMSRKRREHTNHMQKSISLFFIPVKDIQIPNIFFKIPKFITASWASVIADKRGPLESRRKICQL